jgi:predicted SAM-dependent methyltransferase
MDHQEWIKKPYEVTLGTDQTANMDINNLFHGRFEFVHKHYRSGDRMINLACGTDDGACKERYGAVNVDVQDYASSVNNFYRDADAENPSVVDYVCDIRDLPPALHHAFDVAVLGDVMEHCDAVAGPALLRSAMETLVDDGQIMIIFPEDYSGEFYMEHHPDEPEFYSPGIYSYHRYPPLTKAEMVSWLEEVGLHLVVAEDLWYPPTTRTEEGRVYPGVGYGIIVEQNT